MTPRPLFTGVLALILFLAGCNTPATPTATLPAPEVTIAPATATLVPPSTSTSSPTDTPTPSATTASASVSSFPNPQNYTWTPVIRGLQHPTDIKYAPDGSGRLFLLEQVGRIRIFQNGQLLARPFLDISDRVGSDSTERGLLGLAFHPNYRQNGYFYVNYTDVNGNTVIARFQVTSDPNVADPASEKKLLGIQQPYANHNGGSMTFGPDGYLYMGFGDGGSQGDPLNNGQSLNTFLAKILRIDVDHGDPYAIPPDNPFANGGGKPEIWAFGLRNPWRISFDRATGDLYIGDVGQSAWEEVDYVPAGTPGGLNFGWSYYEATHPYKGHLPANLKVVMPVAEYSHQYGCAITGGYVYRGAVLPAWRGIYFYSDYCTGFVWGLLKTADGWQSKTLFQTGFNVTTFGEDEAGELYLNNYDTGTIYRLSQR